MLQMAGLLHKQSDTTQKLHQQNNEEYIRNQLITRRQQQRSFYFSSCTKTTNLILWLCCCCLLFINNINNTNAVPTTFFAIDNFGVGKMSALHVPLLQRSARDASSNFMQQQQQELTAISTESSALDQPTAAATATTTGQCLLDGVLVTEATVFCEQQMGCRAIQKTGHCCPDYKCDCEKDGKVYLNGDKLVDPETPCTVCYCKGGEILCSPVSCFQRDDCTPKYIPGRCCPEYDNCPVVMSETSTSSNWTLPSESTDSTTSASTPMSDSNNRQEEKSKITIKEITKPTEIRIVNSNKGIPIQQQLAKPSTSPAPASALSINNATEAPKHDPPFNIPTAAPTTILSAISMNDSNEVDAVKQNDKTTVSTPTVEPTTAATVAKNQEPITVLSNVPATDIANKVNIKREYLFSREGLPLLHYGFGQFTSTDSAQSSSEGGVVSPPTSAELEPETAGSDNVYHIVLTTDGPHLPSTEGINVESSTAPSTEGYGIDTTVGAIKEVPNVSTATPTTEQISNAEINSTQSTESASISTEANTPRSTTESLHHLDDDEATLPVESNPAYPSLPEDDFSLRDVTFPLSETDDIAEPDEPRSIGGSVYKKAMKTDEAENVMPNTDGSGDGGDQYASSTTMAAIEDDSSALVNVALMPTSHEDSSEEVHISNSTDFETKQHLTKEPKTLEENATDDSQELASLECVDGSSSSHCYSKLLNNTREPTTPRPTRRSSTEVDIDDLAAVGSGDGSIPTETIDDPKLDAESLKLDEKDDNGITTAIDAPTKTNILSIQTNPAQDKTIVELPTEIAKVDGSGRLQRLHLQVFI